MSRLRNPQNPLHSPDPLQVWKTFCGWCTHSQALPCPIVCQSCCFSPKNQAEQLWCPDSARTWAELALQDPKQGETRVEPQQRPPKRQYHKVSLVSKDILVGKSSSDQDVSAFTSRECSECPGTKVVLHISRLFHRLQSWREASCAGARQLWVIPFGECGQDAGRFRQGSCGRNPTGWPAVDRNP